MKISNFKFLDYYKKDFPQNGKFSQEDIDILFYYKTTDFSEIHTHNYWEIMVMCENSLINSLDGREVVMSGFDMCLVKPENVHLIKKYKQNTMKYYNFEIRASWLEKLSNGMELLLYDKLLTSPNIYMTANKTLHEEILDIMSNVLSLSSYEVKEQQRFLRMLIVKIFTEMLFEFNKPARQEGIIDRFTANMRKPENMKKTLKEIAGETGYCIEHIIRQFKKNGLPTPNDMFMKIKLNYACNLLDSTDLQIIKIAEMVGIANVNYFDKVFRNAYGMAPREYRCRNIFIR